MVLVHAPMLQRCDSAASWASTNPVLAQGQIGIDLTALAAATPAIKVGDGATAWTSLPFSSGSSSGAGSATPASSTLAKWDANKNLSAGAFLPLETSTVASATPIVLTVASTQVQTITGTAAQVVTLPTSGVKAGYPYIVNCQNTGATTVKAADGTTIAVLPVGTIGIFRAWLDGANDIVHWIADVRQTNAAFSVFGSSFAITSGGVQKLYPLPATSAPAASTLAEWDAQANLSADAFLPGQTTTAASATPIALTIDSTQVQIITGTTTPQAIQLATAFVKPGYERVIVNQITSANVTVEASDGSTVAVLAPNEIGVFRPLFATPTTNTQWVAEVRLEAVSFKVKTGTIIITTAGTSVVYTLPAASSTLAAQPSVVAVQTANYAAGANQIIPCDLSGAPFAIDLTAAQVDGATVVLKIVKQVALPGTPNALTFNCGGSAVLNVAGGPTSGTITLLNQWAKLQYSAAAGIWYATGIDLSQTDARYEPLEQFAILPSAYTLASQTAAQQLLNTTTNGAITLPIGEYFFECEFTLSGMSATSGSFGFGFGGAATFTQQWVGVAAKGAAISAISAVISWNTANASNIIGGANTATNAVAYIKGRITVTTAGTIIPQVSLSQAAAAIVGAGAFFRIQSVNSAAAYQGAWS